MPLRALLPLARDPIGSAMRMLAKLLAIVALLLTSVGMTAASSAAAPHHDAAAAMPMQHCPDADGSADNNGGVPQCAMVCSAALPAAELGQPLGLTIVCVPAEGPLARSLHGLHPETATPPPKRS